MIVAVVLFLRVLIIRHIVLDTAVVLAIDCCLVFLVEDHSCLSEVSAELIALLTNFECVDIGLEVSQDPGEERVLTHIIEAATAILVESK